jgi:hypothetical protein
LTLKVVNTFSPSANLFALVQENGAPFLFVRGDCRFWVNLASARYRTGDLREFLPELSADLLLGQWRARGLTGKTWTPEEKVYDAPTLEFGFAGEDVSIWGIQPGGPPVPHAPPEIPALVEAAFSWFQRLWAAGEPMEGPLRMYAVDDMPYVPDGEIAKWPLDWPLSSIAVGPESDAFAKHESTLIGSDAEVIRVRAMWDEFLTGEHGGGAVDPPYPVRDTPGATDGGSASKVYSVIFRDSLPFEDESGIVH